jgi:5-methylcytosine-specific restriction endonuclease McrA
METCCICGRPFGDPDYIEFHHLIPKTFKGSNGINIHAICHRKLHSAITEREMLKYYHTTERLLEHEDIQKFIKWVANKHVDFYNKNDETKSRHGKRRK